MQKREGISAKQPAGAENRVPCSLHLNRNKEISVTDKIVLYTKPGSCSLADHIALRWAGAGFDIVTVDRAATKQAQFLALNPAGAVPVLKVGDWVLTQNVAILNYIADRFPEARLGGDGSVQSRAEVNRWLALINSDLHAILGPLFGIYDSVGEAASSAIKGMLKAQIRGIFERLDAQLADKDWLAGARSVADAYLFVVLRWMAWMQIDLSDLKNLNAFFARMAADPGVQAALKAEGLEG